MTGFRLEGSSVKTLEGRSYTGELKDLIDQEVLVAGWVHEVRLLGGINFLLLRDKDDLVQVTASREQVRSDLTETIQKLHREDVVLVRGKVTRSKIAKRGLEIIPSSIQIISKANPELPLDIVGKVDASIDTRLDNRVLDLRKPANRAIFKIASVVLQTIRNFLVAEGFVEVRTPRIISTATEGGADLFEVKYFDRAAYLAQSPQLFKEQLTTIFEKVFEIGEFFRAEKSNTRRHLAEFTSIDIEQAFADMHLVMSLLEKLMMTIVDAVIRSCKAEIELLNVNLRPVKLPIPSFSYDQLLDELKKEDFHLEWGEDFTTPAYRVLGRKHRGLYFITHFPTKAKPFYIQPSEPNEELSDSFDLTYQWLEIASGGTRISDKELLRRRLAEQGLSPSSFGHHLSIYEYGMPPHAGWAAGLERLLMILTKRTNVREVILFPRDRYRLAP